MLVHSVRSRRRAVPPQLFPWWPGLGGHSPALRGGGLVQAGPWLAGPEASTRGQLPRAAGAPGVGAWRSRAGTAWGAGQRSFLGSPEDPGSRDRTPCGRDVGARSPTPPCWAPCQRSRAMAGTGQRGRTGAASRACLPGLLRSLLPGPPQSHGAGAHAHSLGLALRLAPGAPVPGTRSRRGPHFGQGQADRRAPGGPASQILGAETGWGAGPAPPAPRRLSALGVTILTCVSPVPCPCLRLCLPPLHTCLS